MVIKIDRTTPAYYRMCAAGFKIGDPKIEETYFIHEKVVRVEFKCTCGRVEYFQTIFPKDWEFRYPPSGWDVARELERLGSVSEEHLRKDGYSEADIKRIRYVYQLEAELEELKRKRVYDYAL